MPSSPAESPVVWAPAVVPTGRLGGLAEGGKGGGDMGGGMVGGGGDGGGGVLGGGGVGGGFGGVRITGAVTVIAEASILEVVTTAWVRAVVLSCGVTAAAAAGPEDTMLTVAEIATSVTTPTVTAVVSTSSSVAK